MHESVLVFLTQPHGYATLGTSACLIKVAETTQIDTAKLIETLNCRVHHRLGALH